MKLTRRDLSALLPLIAAQTAFAQTPKTPTDKPLLPSKTYNFEDLAVKTNGTNTSRAIMNGQTHESVPFEMHFTDLGPGKAPHPPHQHGHEEIVIVKEGMLDVTINGKTSKAGPGSVVYAASGEMHGWVNNTDGRTSYYVIAIGRDS